MNTMLNNYINGHIKEAKKQAKRYSFAAIFRALEDMGYSQAKAALTAAHLKGQDCWQEACDAT